MAAGATKLLLPDLWLSGARPETRLFGGGFSSALHVADCFDSRQREYVNAVIAFAAPA